MAGGEEKEKKWSAEDIAVAGQVLEESGVLDKMTAATEAVTKKALAQVMGMAEEMLKVVERMEARDREAVTARSTIPVYEPTEASRPGPALMPSSTAVITRRKKVKSSEEIKAYIINAMRTYGGSPQALLNVLLGYITQLQDEMKREHEDSLAARACEGGHPGRAPEGIYCKLCHDAQMAGRFGSIQGQPPKDGADELFAVDDAKAVAPIKTEGL